jgi:DNA-binding NarL/FixJ family response regulator
MTLVSRACGEDYVSSSRLPSGLTARLRVGKKAFIWRHLVGQCHAEHGLIIVKLREKKLADDLTEREKEIALLVAKGRTYKQIAAELGKATATVRNQIQTIYSKLQVNNIAELISALPDHF